MRCLARERERDVAHRERERAAEDEGGGRREAEEGKTGLPELSPELSPISAEGIIPSGRKTRGREVYPSLLTRLATVWPIKPVLIFYFILFF